MSGKSPYTLLSRWATARSEGSSGSLLITKEGKSFLGYFPETL
jgi:hypothetical protein